MILQFSVLGSMVLFVVGCASGPQVLGGTFRPGTKLAVASYQSKDMLQHPFDATATYPTFRSALGDCARLDVVAGPDRAASIDPELTLTVDFVPYFLRGTKLQGMDTAQVAVNAKASARNQQGQVVWADDVSVYSKRFSTLGAFEELARSAASGAMAEAASSLVERLCTALQVH